MSVTPIYAKLVRQSKNLRILDKQLGLPPLRPEASTRHCDYRSSMRSSAAAAGSQTLLHRFSPVSYPKSVAPSIDNLHITTPRRLSLRPSILNSTASKKKLSPAYHRTGAITPKSISKRAQGHAEAKLCKLRMKLKEYFLSDDPKFRCEDGTIRERTLAKSRMLGHLDLDGSIAEMPDPDPPTDWEFPEEIEASREEMFAPSPLRQMERITTDLEIDGRRQQSVMDLIECGPDSHSEMRLTGVWRELKGPEVGIEIEIVASWAWEQEMEVARAREGAVMDPYCRFWTAYASRGTN